MVRNGQVIAIDTEPVQHAWTASSRDLSDFQLFLPRDPVSHSVRADVKALRDIETNVGRDSWRSARRKHRQSRPLDRAVVLFRPILRLDRL